MTFLKELRDAAQVCRHVEYRRTLKDAADIVAMCIDRLQAEPTREKMQALNGAWAVAERILKDAPPLVEPTAPISDAGREPARLAA